MSIQTELTRITNAKAAVKAAIEGKGVTVPDGTLLDGMAPLIESIETGSISNNIVAGSFTLSESLTKASPLYIDVAFPKNEFPLMYCVYADEHDLVSSDTSHTGIKLRHLIASKVYPGFDPACYAIVSSYSNAGSSVMDYAGATGKVHTTNGYMNSGGIYGTMDISLADNQIRFTALSDGYPYLVGRTYNYILYWGD